MMSSDWRKGYSALIVFIACGFVLSCMGVAGQNNTQKGSTGGSADPALPPTIAITAPVANATVNGTIAITVTVSGSSIAGVQYQVDGGNLGAEVTQAPYSGSFNTTSVADGNHIISAIVMDVQGKTASASVTVKVSNSSSTTDTTPPAVSISSPTTGATVSGTINITATATDNVGVVGVQFMIDGTNFGNEVIAPSVFSIALDTTKLSNGIHSIAARARDAAGNTSTSTLVNVTVSNTTQPDTTPPSVSITQPSANATLSGTVTLAVNATDNVGVAGIQFKLDGSNLGVELTTSPFQTTWNTVNATNGSHVLTAVARDAAGNSGTSAPVTVTVSNTAPPPSSDANSYAGRCAQAGVVRCYAFDTQPAQVTSGTTTAGIDPAWDGSYRAVLDTNVYASGGGSLRFDIPAAAGANSAGEFHMDFADDFSVQFGNGSPNGNEFFIQWRQRFDDNYVNLNASSAGGGGEKQIIIGMGDQNPTVSGQRTYVANSCTDMHLVVTNPYYNNVPRMYHNCGTKDGGGYQTLEPAANGDYQLQDAIGCLRSAVVNGTFTNCAKYFPNEWMTFQIHVKAGKDYSPFSESVGSAPANPNSRNYHHDSTVELWIARENQPSKLVLSLTDFDLVQHDTLGGAQPYTWWQTNNLVPRYGKVWLLPYDTGRSASVTLTPATTWYDELIVSKNRIPDPGVHTPNPPDDLIAVAKSANSVQLNWQINQNVSSADNETQFVIERCSGYTYTDCYSGTSSWTQIGIVGPGVNTYIDNSPAAGQPYSYRVRADNAAGSSAYSNAAMNVPGAVADVQAVANSSTLVTVTWSQSAPASQTGFQIERCIGTYAVCGQNNSAYTILNNSIPATTMTYQDNTVVSGTTYTYRVKSMNWFGSYKSWGEIYNITSYGGAATISQVTVP
jgi:hypothetical protein